MSESRDDIDEVRPMGSARPLTAAAEMGLDSLGREPQSLRDQRAAQRRSIARRAMFNSTAINITGVAGLNDALKQSSILGLRGTCHDMPDVGNHSVKASLNIGIANADANEPAPDIPDCRFFTDPGRAMVTAIVPTSVRSKGPFFAGSLRGRLISTMGRPPR
jgi:hypothetical protein